MHLASKPSSHLWTLNIYINIFLFLFHSDPWAGGGRGIGQWTHLTLTSENFWFPHWKGRGQSYAVGTLLCGWANGSTCILANNCSGPLWFLYVIICIVNWFFRTSFNAFWSTFTPPHPLDSSWIHPSSPSPHPKLYSHWYACLFLKRTHQVQNLYCCYTHECVAIHWNWSMVDPPEAVPITKDDSTFLRSHQLLTAPWSGTLSCVHVRMLAVCILECWLSTC